MHNERCDLLENYDLFQIYFPNIFHALGDTYRSRKRREKYKFVYTQPKRKKIKRKSARGVHKTPHIREVNSSILAELAARHSLASIEAQSLMGMKG